LLFEGKFNMHEIKLYESSCKGLDFVTHSNGKKILKIREFFIADEDTIVYLSEDKKVFIGTGSYLGVGCSIGGDTVIGENCNLARQSTVGFDVTLGRCVALGGRARVGSRCNIGDHVHIFKRAKVAGKSTIHKGAKIKSEAKISACCIIEDGIIVKKGEELSRNRIKSKQGISLIHQSHSADELLSLIM
jgi:UDP-3-O-[3-hydroxymyristoyl] glucosamine N-acyltransferase